MERDSLQDKDDLKLKIKQSIKAWAHIFFLIIFHFLDKQSPNNIYAHTVPARVLKVSLIFPFSHSFFRHWQRDESSSPESLKSPFKGYQKWNSKNPFEGCLFSCSSLLENIWANYCRKFGYDGNSKFFAYRFQKSFCCLHWKNSKWGKSSSEVE